MIVDKNLIVNILISQIVFALLIWGAWTFHQDHVNTGALLTWANGIVQQQQQAAQQVAPKSPTPAEKSPAEKK